MTVTVGNGTECGEVDVEQAECDAWIRLGLARGIGPRSARAAVDCAGCAAAVFSKPDAWWAQFAFASRVQGLAMSLREARGIDLAAERAAAARHGARIVAFPQLPRALQLLADAPAALWVRGTLPEPEQPSVAVVGSRAATAYGRLQAARFAGELAELGIVIVSGGARGIDAEAHRAALRAGGITVAVLGGGFDHLYPPEHASLFDAIVEGGGAVVTEFACGMSPRPEYFPRRNRLVSGLSLVVLVVEAAERSGALLTARLAIEDQAREVACVPGPVDSTRSAGCHRAIREGWAQLAHEPEDVAKLIVSQRSLILAHLMPHAMLDATPHAVPVAETTTHGEDVSRAASELCVATVASRERATASSSVSAAHLDRAARGTHLPDHAPNHAPNHASSHAQLQLSDADRALLDLLKIRARCGDELAEALDAPWSDVAILLTSLARRGLARLSGDLWIAGTPP